MLNGVIGVLAASVEKPCAGKLDGSGGTSYTVQRASLGCAVDCSAEPLKGVSLACREDDSTACAPGDGRGVVEEAAG